MHDLESIKLMERAQAASSESKYLDFKREFDIGSTEAWCNVIKDVVAMANSGGGIVIFGLENDGSSCALDHAVLLAYDTADITNKIWKYTNYQFSEVEIVEVVRGGKTHAAFLISAADVPIVFTKPGNTKRLTGRRNQHSPKERFYFRHGSKSEPGNRDDLARWREREIERARKTWMTGIRKVVETGPEETVTVISSASLSPKYGSIVKAAFTSDPTAVRVAPSNAEEIWPYRQVDVIREVNKRLGEKVINPFDITCLKVDLGHIHKAS